MNIRTEGHPAAYRPPRPRSDSPEPAAEAAGSAAAGIPAVALVAELVAAQVGNHPVGTEAVRMPAPEPHSLLPPELHHSPVPEPVERRQERFFENGFLKAAFKPFLEIK